MRDKDDDQVQLDEVDVLSDHLLRITEPAHEDFLEDQVQLLEEAIPVHESCELGKVGLLALQRDQAGQGSTTVEPEQEGDVLPTVIIQL